MLKHSNSAVISYVVHGLQPAPARDLTSLFLYYFEACISNVSVFSQNNSVLG